MLRPRHSRATLVGPGPSPDGRKQGSFRGQDCTALGPRHRHGAPDTNGVNSVAISPDESCLRINRGASEFALNSTNVPNQLTPTTDIFLKDR